VKIARLTGCKNFVGKRKKFIFIAFVDLKPVEIENVSDCVDLGAVHLSVHLSVPCIPVFYGNSLTYRHRFFSPR